MIKNKFNRLNTLLACALIAGASLPTQAAVDADITTMTTDATSVFAAVKVVIISVVSFLILLKIVKKVRAA